MSPLAASGNGHQQVVQLLLAAGANVNATSARGFTPLLAASGNGHDKVVQLLLDAGADVDAATGEGCTSLFTSALNGHLEVVQLLLAASPDLSAAGSNGLSPLQAAFENDHIEVVQLLLPAVVASGVVHTPARTYPPWVEDEDDDDDEYAYDCEDHLEESESAGSSHLYIAASVGQLEVVQRLLAAGAGMQELLEGGEPLAAAASNGHQNVVRVLLSAHAGANSKPELQWAIECALHEAVFAGETGVVKLLLEARGEPHIPAEYLLELSRVAWDEGHYDTLARLAKELQALYPSDLQHLFPNDTSMLTLCIVAEILKAWSSDVSSLDEQQAAMRRQQEDMVDQKRGVQQLIVGMVSMAKLSTQQEPADTPQDVCHSVFEGETGVAIPLLEARGEPHMPADDLLELARVARDQGHYDTLARLAKELQALYPSDLQHLFPSDTSMLTLCIVAEILKAWSADVSSFDEQRAVTRRQQEEMMDQRRGVQQLIVGMAGMAKLSTTQQSPADTPQDM
jgi:ankyrin repeat protein